MASGICQHFYDKSKSQPLITVLGLAELALAWSNTRQSRAKQPSWLIFEEMPWFSAKSKEQSVDKLCLKPCHISRTSPTCVHIVNKCQPILMFWSQPITKHSKMKLQVIFHLSFSGIRFDSMVWTQCYKKNTANFLARRLNYLIIGNDTVYI